MFAHNCMTDLLFEHMDKMDQLSDDIGKVIQLFGHLRHLGHNYMMGKAFEAFGQMESGGPLVVAAKI